jgi:DNA-binding MarR family transcriptional regulator
MLDLSDYSDARLLGFVVRAYRSIVEDWINAAGLRRAQIIILVELYKEEGLSQIELAERAAINTATISEMLLMLEEMQLIIRKRDAQDRRLVRVYLTEAGRAKEAEFRREFGQFEETMFEGVPAEERQTMRVVLHQLLKNMAKLPHGGQECQRLRQNLTARS